MADEYEITCKCIWDLPDGAEIVPYMSPVTPGHVVGGSYQPATPTKPCPSCGKINPHSISSGWHEG